MWREIGCIGHVGALEVVTRFSCDAQLFFMFTAHRRDMLNHCRCWVRSNQAAKRVLTFAVFTEVTALKFKNEDLLLCDAQKSTTKGFRSRTLSHRCFRKWKALELSPGEPLIKNFIYSAIYTINYFGCWMYNFVLVSGNFLLFMKLCLIGV